MEIYGVWEEAFMGFTNDVKYYANKELARKDLLKRVEEAKKESNYASDDDVNEIYDKGNAFIEEKEDCCICGLFYWVRYNNENGDESDLEAKHLILQRITVIE